MSAHLSEVRPGPDVSQGHEEIELVRRAQLGSSAAFEQLASTRWPHLYRYLATRLRNDADALDALQETLTAAWQGLPQLKEPAKFWPWLAGIAAHKAADAARQIRVRQVEDELDPELVIGGEDDETLLEIRAAVASLSEHFREVLLLRYVLQLSEEETAEVLRIRLGTVKSRCARARKALSEVLA